MRMQTLNQDKNKKQGCRCKKINCRSRYCACFLNGLVCSDTCECADCENQKEHDSSRLRVTTGAMQMQADSNNNTPVQTRSELVKRQIMVGTPDR